MYATFGDPDLTDCGWTQAADVSMQLSDSDFVRREGVELVVHSALHRTGDTCQALFGKSGVEKLELSILNEWYITDSSLCPFCPDDDGDFQTRIRKVKQWLASRPERVIAIVGHGEFFKELQRESGAKQFRNLEVRRCKFDMSTQTFDAGEFLFAPRMNSSAFLFGAGRTVQANHEEGE